MINPAQKPTHLNRREGLHAVGATVALATAASRLTGAVRAATPTISASDRNTGGFWPNVARLHDRISGHAGRIRALDRFLTHAKSKRDVWFAREDEIVRYVLANRVGTPVFNRGSPSVTGLPGPTSR